MAIEATLCFIFFRLSNFYWEKCESSQPLDGSALTEKFYNMSLEIHPPIQSRKSVRSFAEKGFTKEILFLLFEAARWSPSCFNEQPWRFVYALQKENPDGYGKILDCLAKTNQSWASQAPLLLIACAKINFTYNNRPNAHSFYDVGQSMAILAIQAEVLGLSVHQMAGFDSRQAEEVLSIPDGFRAITAAAAGYPANLDDLPREVREKESEPRKRHPLEDCVFEGKWGGSSEL